MAWIKMIHENEAEGELQKFYQEVQNKSGVVATLMKIHSLNLEVMKCHWDLFRKIMFGRSGLSRPQREMVAYVVSLVNKCHY